MGSDDELDPHSPPRHRMQAAIRSASRSAALPRLAAARVAPQIAVPSVRFASSSAPAQDPKVKANALIEALPGNSLVSKTGWVTLTTALTGAAVSNEIFVLNEEVVILGSFIVFMGYLSTVVRGPYREWADGQIQKVKDILNTSRKAHTDAVKARIDSVGEMMDVEALTQSMFELSKQTAELEHETFVLKQKAAVAADVKSVLDSWVRYEAQAREAEQKQLVDTVLANVRKSIADKKLQREVLVSAVAEIENLVKAKKI